MDTFTRIPGWLWLLIALVFTALLLMLLLVCLWSHLQHGPGHAPPPRSAFPDTEPGRPKRKGGRWRLSTDLWAHSSQPADLGTPPRVSDPRAPGARTRGQPPRRNP